MIDINSSRAYHLMLQIELEGSVLADEMALACRDLLTRHLALTVRIDPEGTSQTLSAQTDQFFLAHHDWTSESEPEKTEKLATLIEALNYRSFDLEAGLLFRAALIHLSDDRHWLILQTHHIVSDGLSMNILLSDLAELYSARCQRRVPKLPQAMTWLDYVSYCQQFAQSQTYADQEAFWLQNLKGQAFEMELPMDGTALKKYREGCSRIVPVAQVLADAVRDLSRKQGCTLFMTLFSVYALWLHRICHQNRLIIGFPVSGRGMGIRDEGVNSLVGYCTHLLPVISELDDEMRFHEFIQSTREKLLEAYEHQDFPYARLIKQLGLKQDMSQTPLISAVFNLDKTSTPPSFEGLKATWHSNKVNFVDFDLSFNFVDYLQAENRRSLVIECEYRKDLFSQDSINQLMDSFFALTDAAVNAPFQKAIRLPMLTQSKRQWLLQEFNHRVKKTEPVPSFLSIFYQAVTTTPNKTAVSVAGTVNQASYLQLDKLSSQMAHYLLKVASQNADTPISLCEKRVAICLDKSVEQVAAILAVMKAGAAWVPIDSNLSRDRIKHMLEDSEALFLLTDSKLLDDSLNTWLLEKDISVIQTDTAMATITQQPDQHPDVMISGSDLAYVIYTSGSTGNPKGVMVEHACLTNRYTAWKTDLSLNSVRNPVYLQMAAFSFDVYVGDFIRALGSGANLVLVRKTILMDMKQLTETITKFRPGVGEFVPAVLIQLCLYLEHQNIKLDSFERLIIGSDIWSFEDYDRFSQFVVSGCHIYNTYGVTEATVDSTFCEPGNIKTNSRHETIPIGSPMTNVKLYVLDAHGEVVPPGVTGELCIGGDSVARGYLGRDSLTRKKFVTLNIGGDETKFVYRTGDRVRLRPDGLLAFMGRYDDQVKIRGHRIETGEIEYHLNQIEGVTDTVVLVRQNAKGHHQLVAWYILDESISIGIEHTVLRDRLTSILPDYMIPSAFIPVKAFPLNPNGKLDRTTLKAMMSNQSKLKSSDIAETPIEKQMTKIWQDLFGGRQIGINDNFFELGGDSITAIQLVSRARQIGLQCRVEEVFSHPTISQLSRHIELTYTNKQTTDLKVNSQKNNIPVEILVNPIQAWFFEQNLKNPNHWNQALLLQCNKAIHFDHFTIAFQEMIKTHPALRMTFSLSDMGQVKVKQGSVNNTDAIPIIEIDLRHQNSQNEVELQLASRCDQLQQAMTIRNGQLLQVAIFRMPKIYQKDRLFISVNHLVMDGVSWRILIDDLQRAVDAHLQNQPIHLLAEATNFGEYSQRLKRYANQATCESEVPTGRKLSVLSLSPCLETGHQE